MQCSEFACLELLFISFLTGLHIFAPRRPMMKPEGRAKIMPIMEKTDISQPPVPKVTPNA